jgi:RND superfamily putative drug exporter
VLRDHRFLGLLALLTFDVNMLRSLGLAGALVVAASVLAAITLTPALLAVLGSYVEAGSLGFLRPRDSARHRPGNGFWARLAQFVMAHPRLILAPILLVLIGLGLPFLRVELGGPDASILPASVQSRNGFDVLRRDWGDGEISPIVLALQTNDGDAPMRRCADAPTRRCADAP